MPKKIRSRLKKWTNGEYNFTKMLAEYDKPVRDTPRHDAPRHIDSLDNAERIFSDITYRILGIVFCIIFVGVLLVTSVFLPIQGSGEGPTVNEVMDRYIEDGMDETGAVNVVAGLILDYRAFDTLGESFVLFTAVCAVMILMKRAEPKKSSTPEVVPYHKDNIVCMVCRFIIPVIMVFGVYVLLNGHLSPGGGFSGGAILGSGLILYALVFGEDKAAKVFTSRFISTVVLCSLSFYALAKSYSFFTGANHLNSIITTGTPGNIISAGLILPLNIAVGLVVCCTMYSFFMLFRRGSMK